jgi:hypothetical protein
MVLVAGSRLANEQFPDIKWLATCVELVALRQPFIRCPLRRHYEQHIHVRHRLRTYDADRAAGMIAQAIGRRGAC